MPHLSHSLRCAFGTAGLLTTLLASGVISAAPECEGEAADAECEQPTRWATFPIIGYEPETSWLFGGFVQRYFDSPRASGPRADSRRRPRRSVVSLVAMLSLKKQFVTSLEPILYLDDGLWRISADFGGGFFPDSFWEIGPESRKESLEKYSAYFLSFAPTIERQFANHFYLGWTTEFLAAKMVSTEQSRALDSGQVLGSNGGELFGMGPVVAWDSRDRDASPRRGGRYELALLTYPRWLGTDYGFSRFSINLRKYLRLSEKQVLALQFFSRHTAGSVPFYQLSQLGGDGRMRGFFAKRYVDRHTASAQVEYRAHLFWFLGGTLFASAGDVAPRIDQFKLSRIKGAAGAGLRAALNEADGVNLRLDLGFTSEGTSNLYFTVGEAF